MMSNKFLTGAAIAALGMSLSSAAWAIETTSGVRGEVTSDDGAPIADATVTITHVPTGSVVEVHSNAAGVFDVRGLRVGGPYTIAVSAPNYADQSQDNLFLELGDALRFDVALQRGATVTVKATRPIGIGSVNPGTSTTLNRDAIQTVVTTRRDIRDLTRRDPLVTIDNVTRGTGPTGGIYIAGSTPRLNRITIDGVKSADDFGLNTGGLSTTRGPISIEAIEQLTVQAVPFDVSEGDFTGGAVNLVLRGGTNQFHGSAFANYENEGLVGTRIAGNRSPITVHLENYGGFISGPIWKDRAFFAASFEYYDSYDPNAFNGPADLGFGPSQQINGLSGSAGPRLTSGDLTAVSNIYNSYALSKAQTIGSFPLVTPTTDIKNSVRFDFNVTKNQHLQATFRHAESSLYKVAGGATSISPSSNWYIQGELEDNYALQLNSRWTDALSTEARVAFRSYIRHQDPPQGQTFGTLAICMNPQSAGDPFNCNPTAAGVSPSTPTGEPTLNIGPDQFRQANILKTSNLSTDFTGTYSLGRHLIKAGYQSKEIGIYNLFLPQARGIYYFDSVADFDAGKVGRLQYQNNTSGDFGKAAADFDYGQTSLFAQDSWDVFDNLTLTGGVRYDSYNSGDKPALNQIFATRYGFNNQATYDGRDVLMPRFSFKYEPTDALEVSGGVGLFSGGYPDVFLSNSYSNTGVLFYGIDLQRQANGTFKEGISNTILSGADATTAANLLQLDKTSTTFGRTVPSIANSLLNPNSLAAKTASTASIDPNFEIPSDWKANLALRYDLHGYKLGFDAVATQSKEGLAFRDLRARPLIVNGKQSYTPDGRMRYDGLNIAATSTLTAAQNRAAQGLPVATDADLTNLGGGTDVQAYNPSQESWSRTYAFSVAKSFEDLGLDLSLAWVQQESKWFGALSEFSTTPGGFYSDQFSDYDPNTAASGTATNQISDQFKVTASWQRQLFGDLKSHFTLFGETRSGRPFSFLMNDLTTGRGPVFGVNRNDQLLYVPDINNPDATNPLKFVSPTVNPITGQPTVVFFNNAATLAGFTDVVKTFNLPVNRITPKGFGENANVSQVDFQYAQELPTFFNGHTLTFTVDIKNLLNLFNEDWGVVKEYTTSRGGSGRVVSVQCADLTGAALNAGNAVSCPAYLYSNFSTNPGDPGSHAPTVDPSSRYYIQLGLKYAF